MTVAEIENRISRLEARVVTLEQQLARSEIQAAIRRGREEARLGKVVPAELLVKELRAKHLAAK